MSEQASALAPFVCPYCGQRDHVSAALSGCIVHCPKCNRDVLQPQPDEWGDMPIPPPPSAPRTCAYVALGGIVGGGVGSLLLLAPMWFYALSVIGLGVRHMSMAAALGGILGVVLGARLGYRLSQE